MAQIKTLIKQLINTRDNNKQLIDLFPVQSREHLQTLEEKLAESDEDDLVAIVRRIIRRGGIVKNLHNLLGEAIIKDFNYDGLQNKDAFKTYSKVDNLFFKAAEPEVNTFDNYKLAIKKAFKYEKNKMYKDKCLKERN